MLDGGRQSAVGTIQIARRSWLTMANKRILLASRLNL